MKKHGSFPYLVTLLFTTVLFFGGVYSSASTTQTPAPVLFFSDIVAGPKTGNSDTTFGSNLGAYVTLYGNYLSNYTSIELNGSSCLTVVSGPTTWMWYQKMTVAIGSGCSSGNFSITTSGGTWSGPMVETTKEGFSQDFLVNSNHIYYVNQNTGSDTNSGSFASPFASPHEAKITMANGDISYMVGTWTDTTEDPDQGCAILCLGGTGEGGSSSNCPTVASTTVWNAMLGYPGSHVTWGSSSGVGAVETYSLCFGQYIVGELYFVGPDTAVGVGTIANQQDFRFVADDITCPTADSQTGCFATGSPSTSYTLVGVVILGNNIHDIGSSETGAENNQQHAIYEGDSSSLIIAWSSIYNTLTQCRGIQIYSSTAGFAFSDVHIHDNIIHDTGCDAVTVYDTNPAITTGQYGGGAEMYNNVAWNCGYGGWEGASASCFRYSDDNNTTASNLNFYNNTSFPSFESLQGSATQGGIVFDQNNTTLGGMATQNNLIYTTVSGQYYVNSSTAGVVAGSNNLAYGLGAISGTNCIDCSGLTNWVTSNPSLTNTSTSGCPDSCVTNLSLSSASSPANGAGTTSGPVPTYDITGLVRPSPPSIGAYEYAAGTQGPPPAPPTNLAATVN